MAIRPLTVVSGPGSDRAAWSTNLAALQRSTVLEKAIEMSLCTLSRRRDAPAKPLTQEQSGRTWKLAKVLAKATAVFGSEEEAGRWLEHPVIG
ncbi:hypothetical protein [Microvirga massiliensis]|uniref:hypothetical protein n=1 Tax=Microvirga massiliensis TaxID=1033741 RepID=UPI00069C915D|nr:hypothetical protein [Microvirga massiliensis]